MFNKYTEELSVGTGPKRKVVGIGTYHSSSLPRRIISSENHPSKALHEALIS